MCHADFRSLTFSIGLPIGYTEENYDPSIYQFNAKSAQFNTKSTQICAFFCCFEVKNIPKKSANLKNWADSEFLNDTLLIYQNAPQNHGIPSYTSKQRDPPSTNDWPYSLLYLGISKFQVFSSTSLFVRPPIKLTRTIQIINKILAKTLTGDVIMRESLNSFWSVIDRLLLNCAQTAFLLHALNFVSMRKV